MNPMMLKMLEGYLGKDKLNSMLQQWNSMTPQQQQAEMMKVSSMPQAEQQRYLAQRGIDINSIMNSVNMNKQTQEPQNSVPTPPNGRFNY